MTTRMRPIDQTVIRAPVERVFRVASDVERWPDILSHYRWVRFLQRREGGGTVEMAAWRPFGPLRYPTWWVSEMTVDRRAREIRYRHVRGITQGMDVVWQIVPGRAGAEVTIMHDWAGPAWPLVGALAADLVIGPIFIHGIAARTLAGTSARFALADAELEPAREDGDRAGVMMGSALGGVAFAESQVAGFTSDGPRGLDPALALAVFPGAASCNIAIEFGFTGPNSTNAISCASGTIAVGDAFHAIRAGRADVMLAGGAEAPLAPMTYAAFSVIRAMSTRNDDPAHASRPFDEDRDGFVMGEGAAVLVLEVRDRALARGAKVYAVVGG